MSSAAHGSITIGDSAQASAQKMYVLGVDLENPLQPQGGVGGLFSVMQKRTRGSASSLLY